MRGSKCCSGVGGQDVRGRAKQALWSGGTPLGRSQRCYHCGLVVEATGCAGLVALARWPGQPFTASAVVLMAVPLEGRGPHGQQIRGVRTGARQTGVWPQPTFADRTAARALLCLGRYAGCCALLHGVVAAGPRSLPRRRGIDRGVPERVALTPTRPHNGPHKPQPRGGQLMARGPAPTGGTGAGARAPALGKRAVGPGLDAVRAGQEVLLELRGALWEMPASARGVNETKRRGAGSKLNATRWHLPGDRCWVVSQHP